MGGHDPRAKGKIRAIVRTFGKWAKGKQSVCARRLATEHPEVCKGDCNALCAWIKDQWAGTTKWRGSSKDPEQKAEAEAIAAKASASANRRFPKKRRMREADLPVLREDQIDAMFGMALGVLRENGVSLHEVVQDAIGEAYERRGRFGSQIMEAAYDQADMASVDTLLAALAVADEDLPSPRIVEGRYTPAQRRKYATVGKSRYPIGDRKHAQLALAYIDRGGLSPEEKAKVRAKARRFLGKGKKKSMRESADLVEARRFDPSKHPRDGRGRFADRGTHGSVADSIQSFQKAAQRGENPLTGEPMALSDRNRARLSGRLEEMVSRRGKRGVSAAALLDELGDDRPATMSVASLMDDYLGPLVKQGKMEAFRGPFGTMYRRAR